MAKKILITTFCIILSLFSFVVIYYNNLLSNFNNGMLITYDEILSFNNNSLAKIKTDNEIAVSNTNYHNTIIKIELLNFINIASYNVNIPKDEVVVSGKTIGVLMNTDGVTIVGFSGVNSNEGIVYPFKKSNLKVGDRLKTINGISINNINDIDDAINKDDYLGEVVEYTAIRNNDIIKGFVQPIYDNTSKMYKLGLWTREDASGIGTLTFINPKNNRFGALGHGICDNGCEKPLSIKSGTIYQCDVIGINKSEKGKTGELKGMFTPKYNTEGVIDKNNEFGVYGYIKTESEYLNNDTIKIGGRLSIKPGKAKMLCSLDGKNVKGYEIEIIKTNHQNKSNTKSMVVRIIDKELIKQTGGIVQGMSGSPIIQNNKLVGAITHVFINDPTKGFGVYLDWMINQ